MKQLTTCSECGAETTGKTADYICNNRTLGTVSIPLVAAEACRECGKTIPSAEGESQVSAYVKKHVGIAVNSLSTGELLSAGQVAEILGITKQAFSKNPKFKKGHIYFTSIGNKKAYFRSSVELFKTCGDGRFRITEWKSSVPLNKLVVHGTSNRRRQCDAPYAAEYVWKSSL